MMTIATMMNPNIVIPSVDPAWETACIVAVGVGACWRAETAGCGSFNNGKIAAAIANTMPIPITKAGCKIRRCFFISR